MLCFLHYMVLSITKIDEVLLVMMSSSDREKGGSDGVKDKTHKLNGY